MNKDTLQENKEKLLMLWKQTSASDNIKQDNSLTYQKDFKQFGFYSQSADVQYSHTKERYYLNIVDFEDISLSKISINLKNDVTKKTDNKSFLGIKFNSKSNDFQTIVDYYMDNFYEVRLNDYYYKYEENRNDIEFNFIGYFISYKSIISILSKEEYENLLKEKDSEKNNEDLNSLNEKLNILSTDDYKEFLDYKETLKID